MCRRNELCRETEHVSAFTTKHVAKRELGQTVRRILVAADGGNVDNTIETTEVEPTMNESCA